MMLITFNFTSIYYYICSFIDNKSGNYIFMTFHYKTIIKLYWYHIYFFIQNLNFNDNKESSKKRVPPFNKIIQFILFSIGNLLINSDSGLLFANELVFAFPHKFANKLLF